MMSLLLISALISSHTSNRKTTALYFTFISRDGSRIEFYTSNKYILQIAEYSEEQGQKYIQLFDRDQKQLRTVSLDLGVACQVVLDDFSAGKNHSTGYRAQANTEDTVIDSNLIRQITTYNDQSCIEEILYTDNKNPYLGTSYRSVAHSIYCQSDLLNKYFNGKEDWSIASLYRKEDTSTGFWWLFHAYAYPKEMPASFLYSEELSNVKEVKIDQKKFTDLLVIPVIGVNDYRELMDEYLQK